MSLVKSLKDAYQKMEERGWDTIYWAIDLHGVCLKSNYEQGGYSWINEKAIEALQLIASRPESKILLWSSVYPDEMLPILDFFYDHGVRAYGFNANLHESNNKVSCFDQKFYFSILLDDKAGFDPEEDWDVIIEFLKGRQNVRKESCALS
jgi:hypothetical protein